MNVVLCSGFTDDQHALAMRQPHVDVARLRETVGGLLSANPVVELVGESAVPRAGTCVGACVSRTRAHLVCHVTCCGRCCSGGGRSQLHGADGAAMPTWCRHRQRLGPVLGRTVFTPVAGLSRRLCQLR